MSEDFQTQILNSHLGTNNIIEQKDLSKTMMHTFEQLGSILSDHCGPYGKYAIINNLLQPTAEPVFTKDGINIVRSIQYVAPMEEFCRKMVAYVGSRIESEAGDGTTTAMILVITAMEYLCKELTKVTYSYRELTIAYTQFIEEMEQLISVHRMTVDSVWDTMKSLNLDTPKQDAIASVAYHQAYTSSHGDTELSEAVSKLFLNTPPEAWDYVAFAREGFETKNRISFELNIDQYDLEVNVYQKGMLKEDLGTRYDDCVTTFIVIDEDLTLNSVTFQMLLSTIRKAIEEEEKLVVVCSNNMCQQTQSKLNEALGDSSKHDVVIFTHRIAEPMLNDLIALKLVSGLPVGSSFVNDELIKLPYVDCEYKNQKLTLNGLYTNDNDSFIHPYVDDVTHGPMKYMLQNIKGVISNIKNSTTTNASRAQLLHLMKLYNKIYLTRRATIKIGGSAHDNTATVDVVLDVVNAVRASLTKGFVLANCIALKRALNGIDSSSAVSIFRDAFDYGCAKVREATFKNIPGNIPITNVNQCIDVLKMKIIDVTNPYAWIIYPGGGVIIQPDGIDIQILKRFGEVALKFLTSTRVILPGGVFINDKPTDIKEE